MRSWRPLIFAATSIVEICILAIRLCQNKFLRCFLLKILRRVFGGILLVIIFMRMQSIGMKKWQTLNFRMDNISVELELWKMEEGQSVSLQSTTFTFYICILLIQATILSRQRGLWWLLTTLTTSWLKQSQSPLSNVCQLKTQPLQQMHQNT